MQMHKRIRLTPHDRKEIWSPTCLASHYRMSRPTIYKVIARARLHEFAPRKSTNKRFLAISYGLRRLAKVEASIELKKKNEARRYSHLKN